MNFDFKEIRDLYNIIDNSFGLPEIEVIECEKKISITLPVLLKEYYLQLGNHEALNQTQDTLLLPNQLYFDKTDYLIFYQENQAVSIWGIKRQDLSLENPPVYISFGDEVWINDNLLSNFLTSMAYLQSLFAFPFSANLVDITLEQEKLIKSNWEKCDIQIKIWNAEFFQNSLNEVLALLKSENQVDLFVATTTKKELENINSKLNFNWDYYSLND